MVNSANVVEIFECYSLKKKIQMKGGKKKNSDESHKILWLEFLRGYRYKTLHPSNKEGKKGSEGSKT